MKGLKFQGEEELNGAASQLSTTNKGALTKLLFITITVDALTARILMFLAKQEENQYIKRL